MVGDRLHSAELGLPPEPPSHEDAVGPPSRPSVYVAGASAEIDRCRLWMRRLREADFTIACDWTAVVEAVGGPNPREATHDERASWAVTDIRGVDVAGVFWLLVPNAASSGCWVELGIAWARRRMPIIASGDWRKTIFTSLADHRFDTDEDAYAFIVGARAEVGS